MSPRYDAEWVASMLSAERERESPPANVLDYLGVSRGQTVVDVGAGPGFFTLPAAQLVGPSGRVYAVDVEPLMLRLVTERAHDAAIDNIVPVKADGTALPLPDALADVVICSLVLHDLSGEDRLRLAEGLARLLRPQGLVGVIEWVPTEEPRPNRMSVEETHALVRRAKLTPLKSHRLGEHYYLVAARRDDGAAS